MKYLLNSFTFLICVVYSLWSHFYVIEIKKLRIESMALEHTVFDQFNQQLDIKSATDLNQEIALISLVLGIYGVFHYLFNLIKIKRAISKVFAVLGFFATLFCVCFAYIMLKMPSRVGFDEFWLFFLIYSIATIFSAGFFIYQANKPISNKNNQLLDQSF